MPAETPVPERDREERPPKSVVSTGVFRNTVDRFADFAENSAEQTASSNRNTTRILGAIIIVQALILAMIVAGLVRVGITGNIPGVGDIEITTTDK